MNFQIEGKVALVTGGASGLGYQYTKQLLKKGLKGVAILDIDESAGQSARKEFNEEFPKAFCIFIKTDVSDPGEFEDAFKLTVETFKQLDIVINNAGIFGEKNWRKCIDINLGGCIIGTKLSFDTYLPKYKSSNEGVVVNISSVVGITPVAMVPVYSAAKHGIIGLSRAYGVKTHYERHNIRILTIAPGMTHTPMLNALLNEKDGAYSYCLDEEEFIEKFPLQNPNDVAESLVDIVMNGRNGSVWLCEGGKAPKDIVYGDEFEVRMK